MEAGSSKVHKSTQMASVIEEDTINSKLPESLINRVLSFLPTKDVVRTCVLSKRWMNRWTSSITKLDLDDIDLSYNYNPLCSYCEEICTDYCYDYDKYKLTVCPRCHVCGNHKANLRDAEVYERRVEIDFESGMKIESGKKEQQFVNFVGRALLLTSISSMELERFSLLINNKRDISLQNTWISSILNRRVKILRIHSSFYQLPFSALTSHYLFNCTSLEELELVLHVSSTIKFPSISVHFGHLKLLKLYGIFFKIDTSSDCLTLNLPLLRKFDIKNCNWSGGKDLIVEAPLLEIVSIEQDIEFYNAASHDLHSQSIKFNALHLKQFTYSGYGTAQLIHLFDHGFLSFDSAEIICKPSFPETERIPFLVHLLKQFHRVKSIKIEGLDLNIEVLKKANVPVFSLLSNLELGLVTVEVLITLLQNSPILKTLVLKGIHSFAEEFLNSAVLPHCVVSSLQVVKFEKVNGAKHEMFLAKFFMENGMMLEELGFTIASQRPDISKVVEEFKEMVYPFKTRSLFIYCFSY
ncbi:putative F-box domain, FBD domain, leucine-rich repeat domain, L domain-containing protein [Medicago truncatula]|uniref:F-box/RNI/FBD-like domain protein n=1 Tax=Medicago truncatula TaxID=3880 RepID=G7I7U2_MEDTR|nr:F-box/RNI/FBD-like domain protein [Medicago truncatula]RHN77643.1 putative F-box domain, FBD domain, leucine-rich repeat domain, L domain-containing protein [Medicago truncatula]